MSMNTHRKRPALAPVLATAFALALLVALILDHAAVLDQDVEVPDHFGKGSPDDFFVFLSQFPAGGDPPIRKARFRKI